MWKVCHSRSLSSCLFLTSKPFGEESTSRLTLCVGPDGLSRVVSMFAESLDISTQIPRSAAETHLREGGIRESALSVLDISVLSENPF